MRKNQNQCLNAHSDTLKIQRKDVKRPLAIAYTRVVPEKCEHFGCCVEYDIKLYYSLSIVMNDTLIILTSNLKVLVTKKIENFI